MKPRIEEMTIIKGTAISGIVLLHVTAYFLSPTNSQLRVFDVSLILNQWVRVFLPMFLIISGFGLAYNYGSYSSFNTMQFIVRKSREILIPYTIWSLFYFLFYLLIINKIPIGTKVIALEATHLQWKVLVPVFLKNLLFGWNYVHLYFVILIFQFYFLFPWLIAWLKRTKHQQGYLIIGFIIYLLLIIYLSKFRTITGNPFNDLFVRYYWETFVAWYFYFLWGVVIGLNFEAFVKLAAEHYVKTLFFYLITLALVLFEAISTPANQIGNLTSLRTTVLLNTIPGLFFFFIVSRALIKRKSMLAGYLKSIADVSFGIYFVHLAIIFLLSNFLMGIFPSLFGFSRVIFVPILFLGTLGLSYVVVKAIGKVSIVSRLLFGRKF